MSEWEVNWCACSRMIPNAEESWWIEGASQIERYSRWNREIEIYFSVSSDYIVVLQGKAAKQDVGLQHHQGGISFKGGGDQCLDAEPLQSESLAWRCLDTGGIKAPTLYLITEMLMQTGGLVLIFMGLQAGEWWGRCVFKGHLYYLWENTSHAPIYETAYHE